MRYKIEHLGKHNDWDAVEQRTNPVACPLVGGYLADVQEKQRREAVSAKQAFRLVAGLSRKLVMDMPRRVATLPTMGKYFAVVRDMANFSGAFHPTKRGFGLLVAIAAQVLRMPVGERGSFSVSSSGKH